jgi:hypothetical protein
MKHKKYVTLAATGISLAVTWTFSSAAQAQEVVYAAYVYNGGSLAGTGSFATYGDIIGAQDSKADGDRAVTEWKTDYGRSGECHDADGANNGTAYCNYDFKESGYIKIQVVLRNGATGPDLLSSGWTGWLPIGGL